MHLILLFKLQTKLHEVVFISIKYTKMYLAYNLTLLTYIEPRMESARSTKQDDN